ncbi:MAG: hypothetical protein ABIF40_05635 [archaeon]
MADQQYRIVEFVKLKGPALPVQISKHVNGNLLFMSAILSELVNQNLIKKSHAKIGSSPVYYVNGQEKSLEILYKHLGQMPKKAFDLIKEYQVLWDKYCSPAERVALAEIKDFAIPLEVNIEGERERFWKWYMVNNDEAKQQIEIILEEENRRNQPLIQEEPQEEVEQEPQEEVVKKIEEPKQEIWTESLAPEEFLEKVEKEAEKIQEEKIKQKTLKKNAPQFNEGTFENDVHKYLQNLSLEIISKKLIKKDKEVNFVVKVPSNFGKLIYFIKAKNKKRFNEAELTLAYSEGQDQKMPTILLGPGTLTKKAEKFLKEQLQGMVFKHFS